MVEEKDAVVARPPQPQAEAKSLDKRADGRREPVEVRLVEDDQVVDRVQAVECCRAGRRDQRVDARGGVAPAQRAESRRRGKRVADVGELDD
jgi:hypothetical protein